MPSVNEEFVEKVKTNLADYGMVLSFSPKRFVMADRVKCLGYFDEKKIMVAKGNPNWIEVLAHEYSHFIQWMVGSEAYVKCFGPKNYYTTICEEWLHGKKKKPFMVKRAFNAVREMERECEMIAVQVIKDNGLNVDIERYTQEANCYIYMHHLMEEHGKHWGEAKGDPFSSRIIRNMPSSFRHKSHKKIPDNIRKILDRVF